MKKGFINNDNKSFKKIGNKYFILKNFIKTNGS
jgi:hypothetical protein